MPMTLSDMVTDKLIWNGHDRDNLSAAESEAAGANPGKGSYLSNVSAGIRNPGEPILTLGLLFSTDVLDILRAKAATGQL